MKSVWLKNYKSMNYRADKKNVDVIIIGAGLTGLLTAWHLRQSGLDVLVLEAREIGTGTSGNTTGKITSQHRIFYNSYLQEHGEEKARIYADANQWAVKNYIDLIESENIDCNLHVHPAYVYSDEEPGVLEKENIAALKLGLPSSLESVPICLHKALCFRGQAQFHPVSFISGIAEKFVASGGGINEHKRVIDVNETKTCTVITEDGDKFQSDYVVYATLFPILDHSYYAVRLKPIHHFGIAYTYEKQEFDGMYIGINDISFRYHENMLIVVGGDKKMGHAEGAYKELDQRAREKFRIKEEVTRWSAHDQYSGDLVPYIGLYHPNSKRQFTATGYKAWGITHSMIAAKMITDQILSHQNPWSSLFSPGRMSEALKTMVEQAKSAIEHLVKLGKRCPHMGCTLSHNKDDNTLDCPCHGSRFGTDGQILWGPAVKKVKPD